MLCSLPEDGKVGLIKEASLTATITLDNTKYNSIIHKLIARELIDINNVGHI